MLDVQLQHFLLEVPVELFPEPLPVVPHFLGLRRPVPQLAADGLVYAMGVELVIARSPVQMRLPYAAGHRLDDFFLAEHRKQAVGLSGPGCRRRFRPAVPRRMVQGFYVPGEFAEALGYSGLAVGEYQRGQAVYVDAGLQAVLLRLYCSTCWVVKG